MEAFVQHPLILLKNWYYNVASHTSLMAVTNKLSFNCAEDIIIITQKLQTAVYVGTD
jgi:hypothetical protein